MNNLIGVTVNLKQKNEHIFRKATPGKRNEGVALRLESLGQDGANNVNRLLNVGNRIVASKQGLDLADDIVAEGALSKGDMREEKRENDKRKPQ